MKTVKGPVCSRVWGEGGMNRQNTKDLGSIVAILHGPTMMDAWRYTCQTPQNVQYQECEL